MPDDKTTGKPIIPAEVLREEIRRQNHEKDVLQDAILVLEMSATEIQSKIQKIIESKLMLDILLDALNAQLEIIEQQEIDNG